MKDLDPAEAASHDDLIACLEQLYVRADRPSLRELELRTAHLSDRLPGAGLRRVRLGRSAVSEMRRGVKFPKKAFMLTFVEACGVDLGTDRRWEQAWDRLAGQYMNQAGEKGIELEQLRREIDDLRGQLAVTRRVGKIEAQPGNQETLPATHAPDATEADPWWGSPQWLKHWTAEPAAVTTLRPRAYTDAREVGEYFREGNPVIINAAAMEESDARRLVDFATGLIFGLHGTIVRVTDKEFLLSPATSPERPTAAPAAAGTELAGAVAEMLANYGELSVATLRARLRHLTAPQVRELIAYERSYADRPDVIAMFERRVAKLEAPEG